MADKNGFDEDDEDSNDELDCNEIVMYHGKTLRDTAMKPQTDFIDMKGNFNSFKVSYETVENEGSTKTNSKIQNMGTLSTKSSATKETKANGPSRMSLNDYKAGMEGLDKEKINKIIYESSKRSKFYDNEVLKEQQVKDRIKRQNERLELITDEVKEEALIQADKMVKELEESRDLSRTIVHVDMDAFYAAVEVRDDPSLRDKPMAVGSMGMLSTSNYLARRFGVRAAMPGFIGKKLCPNLKIVPPNFEKYREASNIVRNILKEYDPNFLPVSLDEAYLDLTECIREREKQTKKKLFLKSQGCQDNKGKLYEFGNSVDDIVEEIRFQIELETQLTASAGIACNRMLAKVCTDCNKPNGQFKLPSERDSILEFVRDLPIRKISGIGRVTEQILKAMGVTTCEDLYIKRGLIVLLHSKISSRFLIAVSLGIGETRIECTSERKSLSTERTFTEISNPEQLLLECQNLCKNVAKDCKDEELKPKTVTLKLKTVNFEVKSRSLSYPSPICSEKDIWEAAKNLLIKEMKSCEPKLLRLRLLGVRLSNFENLGKKDLKQDTIISFLQKGKSVPNLAVENGTVKFHESEEADSKSNDDLTQCSFNSSITPAFCPICNILQTSKCSEDLVKFNKHIDLCIANQKQKPYFEAVCPVCNDLQVIKEPDYLRVFNKHVDLCLNSDTIKEVLLETSTKKEGGKTESVGGKTTKGSKRKQQSSKVASTPKRATLEKFWSK